MPNLKTFLPPDDPRLAILRDGETGQDRHCVLLWVQRAQRATANLAANLAIDLADRLGLPVIAAFCLVPAFPRATRRAYHFMGEGLAELPDAFARRGVGWELRAGEPAEVIPALTRDLAAALVVTDQNALRIGHRWRSEVAAALTVPMVAVDADVVIPTALFPKEEWAPRTMRPKVHRLLDRFLLPVPDPDARHRSTHRAGPDPLTAVAALDLDDRVGPTPNLPGGATAARARLRRFLDDQLDGYDVNRDRADIDGTSRLSPYVHYGQIGPLEIALAVRDAGRDGAPAGDVASFLDELITNRELSVNFALRNPAYDRYEGIPDWGRKTLDEHRADARPVVYGLDTLDAAATADPVWNAAQRQMVADGWMPNRMRMYWAKQIVRWSATPDEAFDHTVALNDRYFLCGRDPVGYAQIAWAVGGRHDRPFPPNKPILGLVRPMGLGALKKNFDPAAYVRQIDERLGPAGGVQRSFLDDEHVTRIR